MDVFSIQVQTILRKIRATGWDTLEEADHVSYMYRLTLINKTCAAFRHTYTIDLRQLRHQSQLFVNWLQDVEKAIHGELKPLASHWTTPEPFFKGLNRKLQEK